jgi:PAS domain S-box-containing protein
LKAFAEAAGDAIVAADAQGAIVFWNAAAERIFGYTKSEALGRSLALLSAPGGGVASIAAIMRDDTARWNEERALRKRIAELEGKTR